MNCPVEMTGHHRYFLVSQLMTFEQTATKIQLSNTALGIDLDRFFKCLFSC